MDSNTLAKVRPLLVADKMQLGSHKLALVTPHDALESVLEPFDRFGLIDPVTSANLALCPSSLGNTLTRSSPNRI